MDQLNKMQMEIEKMKRRHDKYMIGLGLEVWKHIEGYDNYSISSFGRVRNDRFVTV